MLWTRRLLNLGLLFVLSNYLILFGQMFPGLPLWGNLAVLALLTLWYIGFQIVPWRTDRQLPRRLKIMMGGRELYLTAALWAAAEGAFVLAMLGRLEGEQALVLVANALMALPVLALAAINGFVRLMLTSARLRLVLRVLLLLFWWFPVVNLVLIARACALVKAEYRFELVRLERNEEREESQVCQTRYPILLVHGIFFRDWQIINYWGRIPGELIRNGAQIFYGGQQSAAPVSRSAAELSRRIQEIVAETGCEKVNIIAHSKGGLDSRYAITHLGMDRYVASLTTINTPHRGCIYPQALLEKLPQGVVRWVEGRYNGLFRRLGDDSPDFLGGVTDLTARQCALFNESTPDRAGVVYQSAMSTMGGFFSAPFPLNLTYLLARHYDSRENDGLVALDSAPWGEFLGNWAPAGRRGVSHGDVVDLMREDIPGYDVREAYVELVKGLKERGL